MILPQEEKQMTMTAPVRKNSFFADDEQSGGDDDDSLGTFGKKSKIPKLTLDTIVRGEDEKPKDSSSSFSWQPSPR